MTYLMQTQTDCGPAALSFATGVDYSRVCSSWGWENHGDVRDDLLDSPWHHFAVLEKLRIQFQIVTCGAIMAGKCGPNKTVILLHNLESPFLKQHWVVLESANPEYVSVHWGDGSVKRFAHAAFQKAYSAGTPACAYEVGKGRYKLSWYQRLWVTLTGRFI